MDDNSNGTTNSSNCAPLAGTRNVFRTRAAKALALGALAVFGVAGAGAAHARGDVQWSVQIGGPIGVSVSSQPRYWGPPPVVVSAPVVVAPRPVYGPPVVYAPPVYHGRGYGDADRDGIPNRYDRVYNPRWDRNGNGVPDRRDWRDDRGHRDDRRDDRRNDRRDWRDDRRGR